MNHRLAWVLATVAGIGDRLPAPGTTVGSTVGVALFALSTALVPISARWVAGLGLLLLVPVAVWACGVEAARRGSTDPGPVVLDEVAGQWVALAVLVAAHPDAPRLPDLVASFFLFRLFDIWKPWPIRWLERLRGGWGIVADDLAAGLEAGLVHLALLSFW